jgi:hypothetical protein
VIYNALNFSRLVESNLERMRQLLQCQECGGPVFSQGIIISVMPLVFVLDHNLLTHQEQNEWKYFHILLKNQFNGCNRQA